MSSFNLGFFGRGRSTRPCGRRKEISGFMTWTDLDAELLYFASDGPVDGLNMWTDSEDRTDERSASWTDMVDNDMD